MSRSQGLERFLGCSNGWTCESALPLGLERDVRYVHRRLAVNIALPLGPERTQTPIPSPPLGPERDAWYVHHRVAVNITLPLGPERTGRTATRHRT